MKFKKALFIIIPVLLVTVLGNWYQIHLQNKAFSNLHLKLTGIVDTAVKLDGYDGAGLMQLTILKSNLASYDPRISDSYYYCIIKNNKALLLDSHTDAAYKGDTIQIDTDDRTMKWLNIGRKDPDHIIWVSTRSDFYKHTKNIISSLGF